MFHIVFGFDQYTHANVKYVYIDFVFQKRTKELFLVCLPFVDSDKTYRERGQEMFPDNKQTQTLTGVTHFDVIHPFHWNVFVCVWPQSIVCIHKDLPTKKTFCLSRVDWLFYGKTFMNGASANSNGEWF